MTRTVEEVAETLEIDTDCARNLIKFLLGTDPPLAVCRGERPSATGAGHGPKVYEVNANAPAIVRHELKRLL